MAPLLGDLFNTPDSRRRRKKEKGKQELDSKKKEIQKSTLLVLKKKKREKTKKQKTTTMFQLRILSIRGKCLQTLPLMLVAFVLSRNSLRYVVALKYLFYNSCAAKHVSLRGYMNLSHRRFNQGRH